MKEIKAWHRRFGPSRFGTRAESRVQDSRLQAGRCLLARAEGAGLGEGLPQGRVHHHGLQENG